jgi:sugar O-acyltransferase (sialic acid O-acetyltransferase NeuD family)
MKTKYDLLIYGCGGHARSVIDVLEQDKPDMSLCIIDEQAKEGEVIAGFPVFREEKEGDLFFLAIGDNYKRAEKFRSMRDRQPISILSKTSHIGSRATILQGVFVGNFVHIGPESVIGPNSIINNGAVVEHEVQIGAYCHVGPNATISGRSKLGDFVFVGAGATIIDSINICSDVMIGAGSVVVKNISEPGVYVGCPAKKIKK